MKVGDKVLCKKTMNEPDCPLFIENNWYKITHYDNDIIRVGFNYVTNQTHFFFINKKNPWKSDFFDYFYTKKEIRSMKLKKLKS